jgi:hypothetical protein
MDAGQSRLCRRVFDSWDNGLRLITILALRTSARGARTECFMATTIDVYVNRIER